KGDDAINALAAVAATSYESDVQKLARDELGRCLARLASNELKAKLTDDKVEVRLATLRLMKKRARNWVPELIGLLKDENKTVREESHRALVQLSDGQDFGPNPDADAKQQGVAIAKWQKWWEQRSK